MIALLGGNGYVGGAFQKLFASRKLAYRNLTRADLDYSDPAVLRNWLRANRPDFLINAAGYTGKPNVDACEKDKANCLFGNAVLPGRLAEVCAELDLPWGHVSSGCIYSGRREDGEGFTEDDPPNFSFRSPPCSFYSGTKALGEEVLAGAPKLWIWRLRIPFNHLDGPRNYLSKLMRYDRLLEAENSISHLDEFVAACLDCCLRGVPHGTYNVTNPGTVTTRQVAELIEARGLAPKPFRFFTDERQFMREAAITPRSNCVLNTDKLEGAGIHLTPVLDSLDRCLRDWIPETRAK